MKTVVLYDSKRGVTEECAKKVSESLKCDNYNLRKHNQINLDNYDLIIIGTPLYAGIPMTSVKKFCNNNVDILKKKKLAFFICGLGEASEMIDIFKTKGVEIKDTKKFFQFLSSQQFKTLSKYADSDQIIEDFTKAVDEGFSVDEIMKGYEDFLNSEMTFEQVNERRSNGGELLH
jgi:flavodoxin